MEAESAAAGEEFTAADAANGQSSAAAQWALDISAHFDYY
jgi:hypothetical protein